jgi:hypothetical protein
LCDLLTSKWIYKSNVEELLSNSEWNSPSPKHMLASNIRWHLCWVDLYSTNKRQVWKQHKIKLFINLIYLFYLLLCFIFLGYKRHFHSSAGHSFSCPKADSNTWGFSEQVQPSDGRNLPRKTNFILILGTQIETVGQFLLEIETVLLTTDNFYSTDRRNKKKTFSREGYGGRLSISK